MHTKPTLESVQADFQLWRQNKSSPRTRVPENLKRKAVALLGATSPGKITKALGISRAMLTAWQSPRAQNSDTTAAMEFVSLPLAPPSATSNGDSIQLDLTQLNGNHWCLQGNISASQLNAFVCALGMLSGAAQ
jgi:hypothetical protein